MKLDNFQQERFKQDGFIILRNFYDIKKDIEPIQFGIYQIIGQILKRHDIKDEREPFSSSNFDNGYQSLIQKSRSFGGEVYDAIKQIPAFMRWVSHPSHEGLFRELRPHSIPGIAAGGYGIRIDNPFEEKFRAPWHQEYPAQLRSLDGIVYWSPLVEMIPEMGPVKICPSSHIEGPLRVFTQDPQNPDKSGAYSLIIENEKEILSRYQAIEPILMPGDLMVIDFLLLHSSGYNVSNRSRWSMQMRYFNFNEPTGMSFGWKGSFAAGLRFNEIHPELCADYY
jgi:hypothetical protein